MGPFTASLLIVAMLILNMAWAADSCGLSPPDQGSAIHLQADSSSPGSPATQIDCDACGQACNGHLALARCAESQLSATASVRVAMEHASYASWPMPPPLQPPIG